MSLQITWKLPHCLFYAMIALIMNPYCRFFKWSYFSSPEMRRRLREVCVTPYFRLGNHYEVTSIRHHLTELLCFEQQVALPKLKLMLEAVVLVSTWSLRFTNLISSRKVFTLTKRSKASGALEYDLHIQIGYGSGWIIGHVPDDVMTLSYHWPFVRWSVIKAGGFHLQRISNKDHWCFLYC